MKLTIEPGDVQIGDTIEREWLGTVMTMPVARIHNGLFYSPEDYCMGVEDDAKLYLLDRPTPPVSLPEEPTLGWLTYAGSTIFGKFRRFESDDVTYKSDRWQATEILYGEVHNSFSDVSAFTPATASPTEALDELRNEVAMWSQLDPDSIVGKFLVAINKAATS